MSTTCDSSGFTVRNMLTTLTNLPQDGNIILASDDKGNSFGMLFRIEALDDGNVVLYPASTKIEPSDDDWEKLAEAME